MKKLLLAFVVVSVALTASAYDFPYLTFHSHGGVVTLLPVDGLTMNFESGHLVATHAQGSVQLSVADLEKMVFTSDPSGINDIIGGDGLDAGAEVYSLTGVRIGRYASAADAAQDISVPGVYIVKQGDNVKKIEIK